MEDITLVNAVYNTPITPTNDIGLGHPRFVPLKSKKSSDFQHMVYHIFLPTIPHVSTMTQTHAAYRINAGLGALSWGASV